MRSRNALVLVAVALLTRPAFAAVVEAPAAGPAAFAAPMAALFTSVGSDRIMTLQSPILSAMSALEPNGRFAFVADPAMMQLLVNNLEGISAEQFAALPQEAQIAALTKGAYRARRRAEDLARWAVQEANDIEKDPRGEFQVARALTVAQSALRYLPPVSGPATRASQVDVMRAVARFNQYREARETAKNNFVRTLPVRILDGALGNEPLIEKTASGLLVRDEGPFPEKRDAVGVIARRTGELEAAPQGPWIAAEAEELLRASKQFPSGADLYQGRLEILQATRGAHPAEMRTAIEAFEKNAASGAPVKYRDVVAVRKYYERIVEASAVLATPTRLRLMASVVNGAGGLPSLNTLRRVENEVIDSSRRNTKIALLILCGAVLVSLVLGYAEAFGIPAAITAGMLVWRIDTMEIARSISALEMNLRETFRRGD